MTQHTIETLAAENAALRLLINNLSDKVNFIAANLGIIAPAAPGAVTPGHRQIQGDPRRTETGMGAILAPSKSDFV